VVVGHLKSSATLFSNCCQVCVCGGRKVSCGAPFGPGGLPDCTRERCPEVHAPRLNPPRSKQPHLLLMMRAYVHACVHACVHAYAHTVFTWTPRRPHRRNRLLGVILVVVIKLMVIGKWKYSGKGVATL
jgi:hypothetical protein